MRSQEAAAKLWEEASAVAAYPLLHARGKASVVAADCAAGHILVVAGLLERELPCFVFDERRLRETGAVALYFVGDELKMKTARESTGRRLWNTRRARQ